MVPITCKIDDFDNKVLLATSCPIQILSDTDPISKAILTSYDSSKDRIVNVKVLGGPQFQATQLDTVAEFLGKAVKMLIPFRSMRTESCPSHIARFWVLGSAPLC